MLAGKVVSNKELNKKRGKQFFDKNAKAGQYKPLKLTDNFDHVEVNSGDMMPKVATRSALNFLKPGNQ